MAVNFRDLPQKAQDMLRDLDDHDAALLAIDARRERDLAKERAYPADPIEALRAAQKVARTPVMVEVDDPIGFAISTLEIATVAMDRGGFDDHDAGALVTLLNLVEYALRSHREYQDEANDRIRAITHPQK